MSRVMYDGVSVGSIPADATAVALYIDGRFANWKAGLRRFRKANHVSITVFGDPSAAMIDCEPGNVNALQAARWVALKLKAKPADKPIIYGSRDETRDARGEYGVPAILRELRALGINRDRVRVGSAHYGIGPHICSPRSCGASFTADGTQHTNTPGYDEWLLADGFFPPAPHKIHKPKLHKPTPKPVHKKVLGSTAGTLVVAGILVLLKALGVSHLDATEESFITTFGAAIGGWAAPPGYTPPKQA